MDCVTVYVATKTPRSAGGVGTAAGCCCRSAARLLGGGGAAARLLRAGRCCWLLLRAAHATPAEHGESKTK